MSLYRYCGAGSLVGDLKLEKFGQQLDFTEELAKIASLGGAAITPADHPAWSAFTDQELSLYSDPRTHGHANAAFLAKKKKVQTAAIEWRASLEAPAPDPLPEAVPAATEPGLD